VAPVWLVTAPSLNGLLAYAAGQPGGTALVTSVLDHPSTYVMTGTLAWPIPGDNSIPGGWIVTHAVITPELAGVRECAAQRVPCVFDLEYPVRRDQSPSEQANPVGTFQQARAIMGSGQLVAIPGINLVAKDSTRFGKFVNAHLAGMISPYVNSYAIQAQELEHARVLGWTYPSFVSAIVNQIRAGVHVLGVLRSVASTGLYDIPSELTAAYRATTPFPLSGFWLGISILPYPWTNRTPPIYSIPYQFLQTIH
jgi:hypothetical protein